MISRRLHLATGLDADDHLEASPCWPMRTLAWALVFVAAACSDSKNAPKDASDPARDATLADAPACEPAPLAACATPVSGSRITLRRIVPDLLPDVPLLATAPKNDPRLFVVL